MNSEENVSMEQGEFERTIKDCSIGSSPLVLKRVFHYLNTQELRLCAEVNSLWKEIADVAQGSRGPLIVLPVTLLGSYMDGGSPDPLQNFKDRLLTSTSQLDVGILFFAKIPIAAYRLVVQFLKANPSSPRKFNYLIVNFEKYARLTRLFVNHITECGSGISGVIFPDKIHGLQLYPFMISLNSPESFNFPEDIPLVTGIPSDTKIKCLLFFMASSSSANLTMNRMRLIVDYYLAGGSLALGGARACSLDLINETCVNSNETTNRRLVGCGLAFAGDNFDSWSIVITPEEETEEEIIHRMTELKCKISLRTNKLAFIFSSSIQDNSVSHCFADTFPGVPILSMGQHNSAEKIIGCNFIPGNIKNVDPSASDVFSQKRCVVVLITWGSLQVDSNSNATSAD